MRLTPPDNAPHLTAEGRACIVLLFVKPFTALMKMLTLLLTAVVVLTTGCRTPCRQVSRAEFMRPHEAKGRVTDAFIGVAHRKAYKEIWELSLFHEGTVVLWTQTSELSPDDLRQLETQRKP